MPVPPERGWPEPPLPGTLPLDGVVCTGADGVVEDAGGVELAGGVVLGAGVLLAGGV